MNLFSKKSASILFSIFLTACGGGSDGGRDSSYDFSTSAESIISDTASILSKTSKKVSSFLSAQNLMGMLQNGFGLKSDISVATVTCSSWLCFDATAVSGKYYGTGLLIQSEGQGLSANFGGEAWSDILGTSDKYDFDISSPETNEGTFFCCNGSGGDLSNGSSYISDVSFMLAYADVTFTYAGSSNGSLNAEHKVRFIFAENSDDSIDGEQRGDLLYYESGSFKWVDSDDGSYETTRPSSPVQMNSSVTDWTNESEYGNQTIPVIYAAAVPETGSDPIVVTETDLETPSTYSFVFPSESLVIFPTILDTEPELVTTVQEMLEAIHLQGLPHSTATLGGAGDTVLTITAL